MVARRPCGTFRPAPNLHQRDRAGSPKPYAHRARSPCFRVKGKAGRASYGERQRMSQSLVFSSPEQLELIGSLLSKYLRLPFSEATIPGAVMEGALAHVRAGTVLRTYDFVDVVKRESRCGWQVKSTKATTPVTWKRAKIPDSIQLIAESRNSPDGTQALGNAIIAFCNAHAQHSLQHYDLDEIGYSRLIVHADWKVTYFERLLCNRAAPTIFNPLDFEWRWSTPKKTVRKEQLQALHGINKLDGRKWFAWHGLGENQLHFSGEGSWWPEENNPHQYSFSLPTTDDKITVERFIDLLAGLRSPT